MKKNNDQHIVFAIGSIRPIIAILWLVVGVFLLACNNVPFDENESSNDRVIASVADHKLYLSEALQLLNDSLSSSDSINFLQNYAERWVRDELLVYEAEQNQPDEIDIDELIKDYRESLLIHHFEQKIIRERLDTVITEAHIMAFYEKNKDQFQNDKDMVRAYFIKLRKPFPNQRQMENWWNDPTGTNLTGLKNYSQQNATFFSLEEKKWINYDILSRQLPKGSIRFNDLSKNYERNFADFNYHYFIKVFEVAKSDDNTPVSMVSEQAKMIILHERKVKLLETVKEELYNQAIPKHIVKIMVK
jgi:hypothetical protein